MQKNHKSRFLLSLIIKSLIIIIGITGIYATVTTSTFMISFKSFLYFTIQSNLLVVIITCIFLYFHYIEYKKGIRKFNNHWLLVKFALTVAITVTFLVFFILLAPTLPKSYLLSYDNFSVHLIVPLLALVDFLLFDYQIDLSNFKPLIGLSMPLYYLIFALILSLFSIDFHGQKVPYFFLNYEKLGWLFEHDQMGVLIWVLILMMCISFLSYLLSLICKYLTKINRKQVD
ncbi:MAG: Pr6Pr family membrane protein [Bacilli bacterium]|nr:Pr6Pr family membrane protein [Bacilli bacterium]